MSLPFRDIRLGARLFSCAVSFACAFGVAEPASGHGGGLDGRGCHNDSSAGEYHCHRGEYAGHAFPSESAVSEHESGHSGSGRRAFEEYRRELYMPSGWGDADGDCIDTRHEVLIEESLVEVRMSADGCRVEAGKWVGPYTGETFTDPDELHVDHFVPLAEAHRSGAYRWPPEKKRAFATDLSDPDALLAVEAGANMSKSDRDPAEWLPERREYRCEYVRTWIDLKRHWGLSADQPERRALSHMARRCGF